MEDNRKGLLYHDLAPEEWDRIKDRYEGWTILSDNGNIHPCTGCFSCWRKDHGVCVIKDGYEKMGELIHRAAEVVVISRYAYGGFSGFIKNLFDRSLGYVLPQFEVVGGESHHRKRYPEDKPFTFIFRGHDLSEEDKNNARRYVQAVCANIRGYVKDVVFEECAERPRPERTAVTPSGRAVLLNCSMRRKKANSFKFAVKLLGYLNKEAVFTDLADHLSDPSGLAASLGNDTLVLCLPLYVDGLPSQVIRFLEYMEYHEKSAGRPVYVLANMGLYEPEQLKNLFSAVRTWCERTGNTYCGGLGLAAGELVSVLMDHIPFTRGPSRTMDEGMKKLAAAINSRKAIPDIYAGVRMFPRPLYIAVANISWPSAAKKDARETRKRVRAKTR